MFRGCRLCIVSLGLILAAASPPPSKDRQQPSETAQAKVERSLENMAASLSETNKVFELEHPCEKGEDKRSSDLCAQWKAADAARSAASAAWLFGTLGTLIGALTLGAAAAAAIYAKKAADHTESGANEAKRAADAAEKAIGESRRIGEAQVRCYLSGLEATIYYTGTAGWNIYFRIKNYGQSPAMNVSCSPKMQILNSTTKNLRTAFPDKTIGIFEHDISSSGEHKFGPTSICLPFDQVELAKMAIGEMVFLEVTVKIAGYDVFEQEITTEERFVTSFTSLPNEWSEIVIPRGSKVRLVAGA